MYANGVAPGSSWMADYSKYSDVYGDDNEVELWSRNNIDGWGPWCCQFQRPFENFPVWFV